MDVALREPGTGDAPVEREGKHLVRGSEREIRGEEPVAAGDEVAVGGDRRLMRRVIAVGQRHHGGGIDKGDARVHRLVGAGWRGLDGQCQVLSTKALM